MSRQKPTERGKRQQINKYQDCFCTPYLLAAYALDTMKRVVFARTTSMLLRRNWVWRRALKAARCRPIGADSYISRKRPYDAGMRLLLVEDDPGIARFVAKGLREHAYAVDVVASGEDALYQASINPYDLAILDVMIPAPDGFAVCRELRKSGQRMPILMLTARDAVEDRIAGLDHGADDYLTKPFEFRELLARLRALQRRSANLRPENIAVGDLLLDTAGQNASRAGRNIPLTTKEYALLEFLARNAGRVVGRAEIAEHVWDEEFDPFSNLIEVYVNRIRRKIDAGSGEPLVHTRRGAGYVLSSALPPANGGEGIAAAESKQKPELKAKKGHV